MYYYGFLWWRWMMWKIRQEARIGCLILTLLLCVRLGHAQLIRGLISGTITDPSGAVIQGVQAILSNTNTGTSRETVTDSTGFYKFVAVDPGDYTLEFRKAGFKAQKSTVTVTTAKEVTIGPTLALGGLEAQVTALETPGVDLSKTTPTIDRTFSQQVIDELPMQVYNGSRDISRLALLAPTVSRAPSFTEFSAAGQRSRNNNFMLDGVDNNDLSVTLNSLRIVPEAIQEVQIQTTAYSAEFGRSSGGQFSAVTKSGTNTFRGEAWEYHRGNWMEPVSLPNKRNKLTSTPRYDLNQFGGDLGGPIVENRTFIFGLLDANRRREAPSASNATSAVIPTPSGYAALSTVPLGPGETPAARQAALTALSFLPDIHKIVPNYQSMQNISINGTPVEVGTVTIPLARPSDYWYSVGRLDHRLTEKDSLSYRYHFDQSDQANLNSNIQFGER